MNVKVELKKLEQLLRANFKIHLMINFYHFNDDVVHYRLIVENNKSTFINQRKKISLKILKA